VTWKGKFGKNLIFTGKIPSSSREDKVTCLRAEHGTKEYGKILILCGVGWQM
jgi:hypothetical protein